MNAFEILCVTMHQTDFSKLQEMNIHSNVVFANQADTTSYEQLEFEGHTAKMITTSTRGVGINRNLALMYASGDICLFADDDVVYRDDLEEVILREFEACPDADIIIFHLDTDSEERKQKKYPKTKKHGRFGRMPWGSFRIAIRRTSWIKANIWFTTLFGGGCMFPCGEDSLFLTESKRAGLCFYVSDQTIGKVSFEESSWFSGTDETFFWGKGAFYAAAHPKSAYLWMLYFAIRVRNSELSFLTKMRSMRRGYLEYQNRK